MQPSPDVTIVYTYSKRNCATEKFCKITYTILCLFSHSSRPTATHRTLTAIKYLSMADLHVNPQFLLRDKMNIIIQFIIAFCIETQHYACPTKIGHTIHKLCTGIIY